MVTIYQQKILEYLLAYDNAIMAEKAYHAIDVQASKAPQSLAATTLYMVWHKRVGTDYADNNGIGCKLVKIITNGNEAFNKSGLLPRKGHQRVAP